MKLEIKIPQMQEVLMFFKDSTVAKAFLQVAIILATLGVAAILFAVAWRISGL